MNRGDKVVCVDMSGCSWIAYRELPVEFDAIYTVRAVTHISNAYGEYKGILLEEIHNPPAIVRATGERREPSFGAWRFRKLSKPPAKVKKSELVS